MTSSPAPVSKRSSPERKMPKQQLSIAIVGAGMGGLAAAATLRQIGIDVQAYEQATRFARIGAGIQMMPKSMKVLRGIGIEQRLREFSFAPYSHLNRIGDTGEVTRELPMPETLYAAPYLCMHRAELHDALASALPADGVHSVVRDIIVGPDAPIHRGRIAYRAVFPASLMNKDIGRSRTKWWGSD